MENDSTEKLELIQVIQDFCSLETTDGTKLGRDWSGSTFTEHNMQGSQQNWVKTYMEDITDSSGTILFNNLVWFTKKLCSVMTSASVCEHMWNITGWIHNEHRNRLVQSSVEEVVRVHGNLVLGKSMMERHNKVVVWDSQTEILEPDRHTDEHGEDNVDEENSHSREVDVENHIFCV